MDLSIKFIDIAAAATDAVEFILPDDANITLKCVTASTLELSKHNETSCEQADTSSNLLVAKSNDYMQSQCLKPEAQRFPERIIHRDFTSDSACKGVSEIDSEDKKMILEYSNTSRSCSIFSDNEFQNKLLHAHNHSDEKIYIKQEVIEHDTECWNESSDNDNIGFSSTLKKENESYLPNVHDVHSQWQASTLHSTQFQQSPNKEADNYSSVFQNSVDDFSSTSNKYNVLFSCQQQDASNRNSEVQHVLNDIEKFKLKNCSVLLEPLDMSILKKKYNISVQKQELCHVIKQEKPDEESDSIILCSRCGKLFRMDDYFRAQKLVQNEKMSCLCLDCYKLASYMSNLNCDVKIHLQEDNYFCCSVCGMRFCDFDRFNEHVQEKHFQVSHCEKQQVFLPKLVQRNEQFKHCPPFDANGYTNSHLDQNNEVHDEEKPFMCLHCGKKFVHKRSLNLHVLVHGSEKPYECMQCQKRFYTSSQLQGHERLHSREKCYDCSLCDKKFYSKNHLEQHKLVHNGDKRHECLQCGKKFFKKSSLDRHRLVHSGERPFECSQCEKRFFEKSALKQHQLVHTGVRAYECVHCGKTFSQKSALNQHNLIHSGVKGYECSKCGKKFTTKRTLNQHNLVHSEIKPYECLQCGKKFSNKSTFNQHVLVHSGERPYDCSVCGKKFFNKGALNQHKVVHTGAKPYECLQCGKKFAKKSSLNEHQVVHSGERPYECVECGKKFTKKSSLTQHRVVHSGEKPHECLRCGKRFSQNSSLSKHKSLYCSVSTIKVEPQD